MEGEQKAIEVFKDIGIKSNLTGKGRELYWKVFPAGKKSFPGDFCFHQIKSGHETGDYCIIKKKNRFHYLKRFALGFW